jgi:hypothetical protein
LRERGGGEIMILVYTWMLSAWEWLGVKAEQVLPARAQRLLLNSEGGIDSPMAWIIGIAVIGGVTAILVTTVLIPALSTSSTATNNAISSIP